MRTVIGLFNRRPDAECAIIELSRHDFDQSAISVMIRDDVMHEHLAQEPVVQEPVVSGLEDLEDPVIEKDVGTGIALGAPLGGLSGFLVGAGSVAVPGLGPVLAGGALGVMVGTWLGTLTGGAIGRVVAALVEWGLPEAKAETFVAGVKRGGILLAVQTSDKRAEEAREILCDAGAVDAEVQRAE
jgi:hypothetical protein